MLFLDASEVRRVLYSIARFQAHISHQSLANTLFQRALILHPELFLTPESIQEADVVFQVFGKEYCPDLYAFFLSRSAAISAAPPPPPRQARSLDDFEREGEGEGEGEGEADIGGEVVAGGEVEAEVEAENRIEGDNYFEVVAGYKVATFLVLKLLKQ